MGVWVEGLVPAWVGSGTDAAVLLIVYPLDVSQGASVAAVAWVRYWDSAQAKCVKVLSVTCRRSVVFSG